MRWASLFSSCCQSSHAFPSVDLTCLAVSNTVDFLQVLPLWLCSFVQSDEKEAASESPLEFSQTCRLWSIQPLKSTQTHPNSSCKAGGVKTPLHRCTAQDSWFSFVCYDISWWFIIFQYISWCFRMFYDSYLVTIRIATVCFSFCKNGLWSILMDYDGYWRILMDIDGLRWF